MAISTRGCAGTFSTELPAGARDASGPRIEDFRLPRVGGGELALADHPPPLVIVVGDAAGIRKMVARLLPLTRGGVRPRVIGMLVAVLPPDWKGSLLNPADVASLAEEASKAAGSFPVPVGVDIKGAAGYQISQAAGIEAGQTKPTAVGFVASDGSVAHASTDAATDGELRELIGTLQCCRHRHRGIRPRPARLRTSIRSLSPHAGLARPVMGERIGSSELR